MQNTPQLISSIVKRIPAVLPHLNASARYTYCEYKQKARDPREPGLEEKQQTERKIKTALLSRFKRQFETLKTALNSSYEKSITADNIYIPDDPQETQDLIGIFTDGTIEGAALAESLIGFSLSDGSINKNALLFAQQYVTEWLRGLDKTSEKAVRDALSYFVTTPGATVGNVIDVLEREFDSERAWRIAITETTRIYAEANQIFAQELAGQYPDMQIIKRYYTNNDDLVCPICSPLDGKEAAYNDDFAIPNPPLHVNCRCWTSVTVKA